MMIYLSGKTKPTATIDAIMQGLPLGGARRKRIRDGVALYSPALKIYTIARLCYR
jgi:hypothetical protein